MIDKARLAAIAEEAGTAIMEVYGREGVDVTMKEDRSPLTEADLAAHRIIAARLGGLTPEIPLLSEESREVPYAVRREWERFWLVDPLDGTKEFIKRNGEFTVNIALIEGGTPVMGVVHAPALGVTYTGGPEGAFRIDREGCRAIRTADHRKAAPLKIVASRSHRGEELEAFLARLDRPYDCLAIGSSLKLCMVAEGSAHLYPRLGPTMEWDTAAADAVVRAAGGMVESVEGGPLSYNKENLLNPFFMVTGHPPFEWRAYGDVRSGR